MELIYADILKHWTACWQEAFYTGLLFMAVSTRTSHKIKQQKGFYALLFADGVFIYYLLYVTLLSRWIGFRREVEFLPFAGFGLPDGNFHYVVENVLLFIPFGILLCMTLCVYGRTCNAGTVLAASFLTSVSVELLQYAFSCGKSETDDVITNVSGALIGYAVVKLKRGGRNFC